MERVQNIFTKRVKKFMMIYSMIACLFTTNIESNIDNSIRSNINQDIERIDIRTASFHDPMIARVTPVIESEEDTTNGTNVVEEEELVEDGDEPAQTIIEETEIIEDEEVMEAEVVDEEPIDIIPYEEVADESQYSEDEIYLMAKVCLAEAEGESELGKRLVISTILNRIDSGYYSDNVYDVVYQPYQFEVMMNGRIDRVTVTDDIIQLVKEEINNRTNYNVIYFRTDYYSEYGTPLFQEDSHYFSGF